ncbi:MAG: cell division protein FtsN [Cellvibrionaceae bacterium]|jgi:cell division protein FtsN
MNQDFAKKKRAASTKGKSTSKRSNSRRAKPKQQKAPAWAWLVIGLLLAAFITLLIYLANKPEKNSNDQVKPSVKKDSKPPQPRFDFYEILKERQVKVPDRLSEIQAATPQNIRFYLQAGSFRNRDDAERLRAELVLVNLPTTIESKASDKGAFWHRVIVGPFKSRSKVAKARSTLASKKLSPLLLKRTVD